jgi:hypothetical protein
VTVRKVAFGLAGFVVAAVGFGVVNNNFPRASTPRAEFEEKLNRSYLAASDWILGQDREPNIYLAHMIQDCAVLSGDARLRTIAERAYREDPRTPNARIVDPSAPFLSPPSRYVERLADYQRWLLYAISRKEFSLTEADKAEMFRPDKHRTGRATHQLFALLFYRKFNGETPALNALIRRISERIAQEAALDFRVTDLYLQRITFLLAAGQPDLVQPRWVERALACQEPSGGWFYGWYGWQPTPYKFDIEDVESRHATAQGLWLTCMLKYRYPEWVSAHYK